MPIQQTSTSALVSRLNSLLGQDHPNEFTIESIKRDAQKLVKVDAYTSYLAQGMLSCLEVNLKAAKEFHAKALNLNNSAFANMQYAVTLSNLGQYKEAFEYVKTACKIEPDNKEYIEKLIVYGLDAFKPIETYQLLDERNKKILERPHHLSQLVHGFYDFVCKENLNDEMFDSVSESVSTVCKEMNVRMDEHSFHMCEEDGVQWIDVSIRALTSIDKIVDMNITLSEYVAMNTEPKVLEKLVVRFTTAKIEYDNCAA